MRLFAGSIWGVAYLRYQVRAICHQHLTKAGVLLIYTSCRYVDVKKVYLPVITGAGYALFAGFVVPGCYYGHWLS